jgi:hypothetical protein
MSSRIVSLAVKLMIAIVGGRSPRAARARNCRANSAATAIAPIDFPAPVCQFTRRRV